MGIAVGAPSGRGHHLEALIADGDDGARVELASPAGFGLTVDQHLPSGQEDLGVGTSVGDASQLQELTEAHR